MIETGRASWVRRDGSVRDLLGSERPTGHDFEAMDAGDDLGMNGFCWCGRCTVLYRDGRPHELAFWGISGD